MEDFSNEEKIIFFCIIVLLILFYLWIIIFPPLFACADSGFSTYIKFFIIWGGPNRNRTIINNLIVLISAIFIIFLVYNNIDSISSGEINWYLLIGTIFFTLFIALYIFFFYAQYCALKMCKFNKYKTKELKDEKYISFCLVGDTQVAYNDISSREDQQHHKANLELVNILNKFNSTTDINDFDLDDNWDDNSKKFLMDSKKNLTGVIHVGDLVHWPTDSRFVGAKNSIAMNYYIWQNNPTDGGLLQIPLYEVLGNHDLFGIDLWYRADGSPCLKVHNERVKSKNYVVNVDKKYGHYSCDFGNLHIIFINGITANNIFLISNLSDAHNISGIEFLEQDLKLHGNKPFFIVTHVSKNIKNWELNYPKNDFNSRYDNLISKYAENFYGVFNGHWHFEKGFTRNQIIKISKEKYMNRKLYKYNHEYQALEKIYNKDNTSVIGVNTYIDDMLDGENIFYVKNQFRSIYNLPCLAHYYIYKYKTKTEEEKEKYKKWLEAIPNHKDIIYRFTYMVWNQEDKGHFIREIEYNLKTKKFKIKNINKEIFNPLHYEFNMNWEMKNRWKEEHYYITDREKNIIRKRKKEE